LHDKAVIHEEVVLGLGEWAGSWADHIINSEKLLAASDPLCGVDFIEELKDLKCLSKERWIWPLGPRQTHIVEALAFRS
jgi:hypothetical protein